MKDKILLYKSLSFYNLFLNIYLLVRLNIYISYNNYLTTIPTSRKGEPNRKKT